MLPAATGCSTQSRSNASSRRIASTAVGTSQASFGSTRSSGSGADRLAHGADDLRVVAVLAADLDVDDAMALGANAAASRASSSAVSPCGKAMKSTSSWTRPPRKVDAGTPSPLPSASQHADSIPLRIWSEKCGDDAPAAVAPELAEDRLDVAGRAADERARHQAAVGDDGGRVLADRLAVPGHALVGLDREEDEVHALLHAGALAERLHERERDRRRGDGGDLHALLLSAVRRGDHDAVQLERRLGLTFSFSTSSATAAGSRSSGSPQPPPPAVRCS